MPQSVQHPIYRQLIKTIVDERIRAGLTQQVVATRLGHPQSYVAKIEGLERRLDALELLEFALAIGFDPTDTVARAWRSMKTNSNI